jgi:hypothetical protein
MARHRSGAGHREEAEKEIRWTLDAGERLADPVTIGYSLFEMYLLSDYETGIGYAERALAVVGCTPTPSTPATASNSTTATNGCPTWSASPSP